MERPFALRAASCTDAGRRPVNQDAVLLARFESGVELIAVADGMGGHAAGEVASNRALEVLHSSIASGDELPGAVRAANAAVHEEALAHPEYGGMGTTLVAALRQADRYEIVNVGDSRAYRIDATGIVQLTRDNSFVAEALRSGQLTEEEAASSPWRNAVTRCLGTDAQVEVDCYGPFDADGHTLLLCTDGVHRVLSDDVLYRMASDAPDAEAAARAIATAAYEAGSDDNISVALIGFERAVARTIARGPSPLLVPQLEMRRRRRRLPGGWALVRAAVAVLAVASTLVYIVRTLMS